MKPYGDKLFSDCAPKLWNQLPNNIRAAGSVANFKRQLKTFVPRCIYQLTMWISTSIRWQWNEMRLWACLYGKGAISNDNIIIIIINIIIIIIIDSWLPTRHRKVMSFCVTLQTWIIDTGNWVEYTLGHFWTKELLFLCCKWKTLPIYFLSNIHLTDPGENKILKYIYNCMLFDDGSIALLPCKVNCD